MFDLGWSELLVIGAVALLVLGPKELPNALRTISNLTKTARKLASEFQGGINEIVREADLEDARKAAQSINKGSFSKAIENVIDPTGEVKATVTGVEKELKEKPQISPIGPIAPAPQVSSNPPASPAIAAPEQKGEAPDSAAPEAKV